MSEHPILTPLVALKRLHEAVIATCMPTRVEEAFADVTQAANMTIMRYSKLAEPTPTPVADSMGFDCQPGNPMVPNGKMVVQLESAQLLEQERDEALRQLGEIQAEAWASKEWIIGVNAILKKRGIRYANSDELTVDLDQLLVEARRNG